MAKKKSFDFDEKLEELDTIIFKKEEEKERKIVAIPTGSISLDISIGVGGIPLGRFTELFGSESTGKTTLGLSICKNALSMGYRVLYCDVEQGLDMNYVSNIVGDYDESQFIIVRPEYMEQALSLAEYAIRSKEFGLIVVDSIGSMLPRKVQEDNLTDANVALLARLLTIFIQRNAYELRRNNVAFLGINQVRDKIGSYYATFETPGGHTWKHNLSLRIQLNKAGDIKVGEDKIGILTKFVVKKNKLAPPLRTYSFPIMYGEGVDSLRDLVDFSTMIGVLSKSGSHYMLGEEAIAKGMNNMVSYLKEHPETIDKIKDACYNAVKNKTLVESEEIVEDG